jgi:glycosyltransferase involved in cell wall biosynthesis
VSEPGATAPLLPADPLVAEALAGIKAEFGGSDWLCVADIEPLSGQDDLIKALWAFSRLYGLPARLHLVGATPDGAYLGALRDFVEDLGLVGAVQLVGPVSAEIAAAYFAAADVYVTASVADTEGTRRAVRAGRRPRHASSLSTSSPTAGRRSRSSAPVPSTTSPGRMSSSPATAS